MDGGVGLRPYPPCETETDVGQSLVSEWLSLLDAWLPLFSLFTHYKINLKSIVALIVLWFIRVMTDGKI